MWYNLPRQSGQRLSLRELDITWPGTETVEIDFGELQRNMAAREVVQRQELLDIKDLYKEE